MLSCARTRSAALSATFGRRAASVLAGKYAKALYGAALSKSPATLTKVQGELSAIATALKSTPALSEYVSNPTLSAQDRLAGLKAVYASAESASAKKEPVSDVTKNLFALLAENGRLVETPAVIEGFDELVAQYRGELTVTVSSAEPLPKDVQTKLEATLKQSQAAQQAKSLKIVNKINPALLGGLVVDFGDKTIDLSVQSRVTKLNSLLQESV